MKKIQKIIIKNGISILFIFVVLVSHFQILDANTITINLDEKKMTKEIDSRNIIYIPDDYSTIQAAITASSNGDHVVVRPGTYVGNGNRDITFQGKAITVRSTAGYEDGNEFGSAGFWNTVEQTIIDCQGTIDDSHRGFIFENNETSNSVLHGFTIQNGFINRDDDYFIFQYCQYGGGGAILIKYQETPFAPSNPTIQYNILKNNKATTESYLADVYGGAIFCFYSRAILKNNKLINNEVYRHKGAGHAYGGGIAFYASSPIIIGNTILDNTAHGIADDPVGPPCSLTHLDVLGGGIYMNHGPVDISHGYGRIEENIIQENKAQIDYYRHPTLIAQRYDLYALGGGIYDNWHSADNQPSIMSNVICNNDAVIFIHGQEPQSSNEAFFTYGGGYYGTPHQYIANWKPPLPIVRDHAFLSNQITDNKAFIETIDCSLDPTDQVTAQGGGMFAEGTNPLYIIGCTIANNLASVSNAVGPNSYNKIARGGGIFKGSYNAYLKNCIIWNNFVEDNMGRQLYSCQNNIYISNSVIQQLLGDIKTISGSLYLQNCIDSDPLFVGSNNYHLRSTSPCIDSGETGYIPRQDDPPEKDIDGQTRIDLSGNIDMGADEYQTSPCSPGDMNNDGVVDFDDVNIFIDALSMDEMEFITIHPESCYWAADCNQDGVVDFNDINSFITILSRD
ncbi:MAG: hypothetical protein QXL17_03130 [Candidatus Thermoplasmatota archaeon]